MGHMIVPVSAHDTLEDTLEIHKPVFIVGSGRSGTTVFYNFLAIHPELCWFSNYSDRYPGINSIPRIHSFLDSRLIGGHLKRGILSRKKYYIKPSEAQTIYHSHCGFHNTAKTTEIDLSRESEKKLKNLIRHHMRLTGKTRFLSKQTANNQRIRLIDAMFKDAYYIHVIRDGRAVASSLLRVPWWKDLTLWWLGKTPKEWEREGGDPIELCGLQWKADVQEILQNKHLFEDRYIEIRYEDFIRDVKGVMASVLRFCELEPTAKHLDFLPDSLPDMNRKWQHNLDDAQKKILQRELGPFLAEQGY